MGSKPLRCFLVCILVLWGMVSLAAIAGMYQLWWERERVQYFGKSEHEQRTLVFRNAGLPEELLDVYQQVDRTWPRDIAYRVSGDHTHLSYLKYLLLPRIPAGSEQYRVHADGSFSSGENAAVPKERKPEGPSVFALLGPLFLFGGMALALQRFLVRVPFSFPEVFGLTLLICMAAVVLSRVVLATAVPGFFVLTLAGGLSWIWLLFRHIGPSGNGRFSRTGSGTKGESAGRVRRFIILFLIGLIACNALWVLLMSVVVVPDDWDAWAIWGPKAKVLALGLGPLADVTYFGHADYPLLWPALWAFSGWLGGGWEEMWSKGWGAVFFMLCAWEIAVIIARITGQREWGLLGAALFVSIPMVPVIASWGYAETPYWLLIVACCGCLSLRGTQQNHLVTLVAGLLAAAAAYTKNEGLMFIVLAGLWILILPGKNRFSSMLLFFGVAFLCYSPWWIWTKYVLQLGSHATSGLYLDGGNIERIIQRLPSAIEAITRMWADIRQWNVVLWLGGVLALLGLLRTGAWVPWFLLSLAMIAGYFIIIVFHEAEVYWQVGTAWNRLTIHALPFLLIGLASMLGLRCFGDEQDTKGLPG